MRPSREPAADAPAPANASLLPAAAPVEALAPPPAAVEPSRLVETVTPPSAPAVRFERREGELRAWVQTEDHLLGPLRVEVTHREGRTEAVIAADRPETVALIQSRAPEIREALQRFEPGAVSVQVRYSGAESGGRQQQPTPQNVRSEPVWIEPRRQTVTATPRGLVEVYA